MKNSNTRRSWGSIVPIVLAGVVPILGVLVAGWGVLETALAIWAELAAGAIFFQLRGCLANFNFRGLSGGKLEESFTNLGYVGIAMVVGGFLMAAAVAPYPDHEWFGDTFRDTVLMLAESPELFLPAVVWCGVEVWRLYGDVNRGRPLAEGTRGMVYFVVGFGGALLMAWQSKSEFSPPLVLVPLLVLKIGADVWVFRYRPRKHARERRELHEELASLLMLEVAMLRKYSGERLPNDPKTLGERAEEFEDQLDAIWAHDRPDYEMMRAFYQGRPEWLEKGGDVNTSSRILEILDLIRELSGPESD